MKWVLIIILSLCSFFSYADKCKVNSGGDSSGVYTFKPSTMNGSLIVENIESTGNIIVCDNLQNVTISANAGIPSNKSFVFNVGEQYYNITFTVHSDDNWKGLAAKVSYNLNDILSGSKFNLTYSITPTSGPQGVTRIEPGVPFPLISNMEIQACQGNGGNCVRTTFKYTLNITLQVNIMTCGIDDQSLDVGKFQLFNVNTEQYQAHQIKFNCKEGQQGELKFQPGSINYYFEPVSGLANGTSILLNELENDSTGAGQIGFQISMDGIKEIQYGRQKLYQISSPTQGQMTVPIHIRPRTYGSKISSGEIRSRARVVVIYN